MSKEPGVMYIPTCSECNGKIDTTDNGNTYVCRCSFWSQEYAYEEPFYVYVGYKRPEPSLADCHMRDKLGDKNVKL